MQTVSRMILMIKRCFVSTSNHLSKIMPVARSICKPPHRIPSSSQGTNFGAMASANLMLLYQDKRWKDFRRDPPANNMHRVILCTLGIAKSLSTSSKSRWIVQRHSKTNTTQTPKGIVNRTPLIWSRDIHMPRVIILGLDLFYDFGT